MGAVIGRMRECQLDGEWVRRMGSYWSAFLLLFVVF